MSWRCEVLIEPDPGEPQLPVKNTLELNESTIIKNLLCQVSSLRKDFFKASDEGP